MAPLARSVLLWLMPAAVLCLPNPHPVVTPAPVLVHLDQRGIVSDAHSIINGIESTVASAIASGIPQLFASIPSGSAVESALGISDHGLDAIPTQVLNMPAYANWTNQGWNILLHGNVYKVPNISESKLDDLANVFLIDTDIHDLPAPAQDQARNVTASIFVVQQKHVNVTIAFTNDHGAIPPPHDGGAVAAAGGAQTFRLPGETTDEGDYATWLVLNNTAGGLTAGNQTTKVQTLDMHVNGTDSGNATAYLVPPTGFTVISDIDDILRVTKIWDPKEGLLNTFARPFTPWLNMPDIYAGWASTMENLHFHYLTTTPEQATRNYMDFIFKTYPPGSFDTRPLNFSDTSATLAIRKFLLERVVQTYPGRKFVLVADTSNRDVMKDYPQLAHDYPDQIQCIWLRNTSSTDPSLHLPYDTSGFKGLDQSRYMFFKVPDDLRGLDIAKGQCYNASIPQNVTFDSQGGSLFSSGGTLVGRRPDSWVALVVAVVTVLAAWC